MNSTNEVETSLQIIFNRIRIAAALAIIKIKPGGITAKAFAEELQSNLKIQWQNDDLRDPIGREILSNERKKILFRLWNVLPPEAQIPYESNESDSDIFSDYDENDDSDKSQDSDSSIAESLLLELNVIRSSESRSSEGNSFLSKHQTSKRFLKKLRSLAATTNQSSSPLASFETDLNFIQAMIWLKSAINATRMVPVEQFRKVFKTQFRSMDRRESDDSYEIFMDDRASSANRAEVLSPVHPITEGSTNLDSEGGRSTFNLQIADDDDDDILRSSGDSLNDCSVNLLSGMKTLRFNNSLFRRNRMSNIVDVSSSKSESPVSSPQRRCVDFNVQNSQDQMIIAETEDEDSPFLRSQEMGNRITSMLTNVDSGFNSQRVFFKAAETSSASKDVDPIDENDKRKIENTSRKKAERLSRMSRIKKSKTRRKKRKFVPGTAAIVRADVNDFSASGSLAYGETIRSIVKPVHRFRKIDSKYVRFDVTGENIDPGINVNLTEAEETQKFCTINKGSSVNINEHLESLKTLQYHNNDNTKVLRANEGKSIAGFKRSCMKRKSQSHSSWVDTPLLKRPRTSKNLGIPSTSLNFVIKTSDASNVLLTCVRTILRIMESERVAINYSIEKTWQGTLEKEALEAVVNLVDLLEIEKGSTAAKNEAVGTIRRVFERILKSNELDKGTIWNHHVSIILELCNSLTICKEAIEFFIAKLRLQVQQIDAVFSRQIEDNTHQDVLIDRMDPVERSYFIFKGLDVAFRRYKLMVSRNRESKPEEGKTWRLLKFWKRDWRTVDDKTEVDISEKDRKNNWMRVLEELAISNADDKPEIALLTWKCLAILKSSDNE